MNNVTSSAPSVASVPSVPFPEESLSKAPSSGILGVGSTKTQMHSHAPRVRGLALIVLLTWSCGAVAQASAFQTPYVTRAEAAMILLKTRLKVDVPPLSAEGRFPDVIAGTWEERYMVFAERYGILEAQRGTGLLRPSDVVLRSEFLKMVTRTFALPENLPYFYTDVPSNAWYTPYAGSAERYGLFPADPNQNHLSPETVMSHQEVARALQVISKRIDAALLPPLEDKQLAAMRSAYTLALYQKISTERQEVTLVQAPGPALAPALFVPSTDPPVYADEARIPALRDEIRALVNVERAKEGFAPLTRSGFLEASAQGYAEEMAARGFFGHVSPEGQTLRERAEASGYYRAFFQESCLCTTRFTMGENIARGQRTPEAVVQAWMASPSHRAAILSQAFTDIGIGIRSGMWVQHFGGEQKTIALEP